MPKHQVATRRQPLVQVIDHALPRSNVEIDQNITAEDGVDSTDQVATPRVKKVHLPELTQLFDCITDVKAVVHL